MIKRKNPKNEALLDRLKIVKDYVGFDHDFYDDKDADIINYWVFFDHIPSNISFLLKEIKILSKYPDDVKALTALRELRSKRIGIFSINVNNNKIYRARVADYAKNNGIATFMYDYIEKDLGVKIIPDFENQTLDGKAFWKARLKKNPRDEELLSQIQIKKKVKQNFIEYRAILGETATSVIGTAYYRPDLQVVEDVYVSQRFQKRGIASVLYDYIEQDQNIKLKPSATLLPDGEKFWQNRLKKNPKQEPQCPRCGSKDITIPRNYGKPQKDRLWCMKCGALWNKKN